MPNADETGGNATQTKSVSSKLGDGWIYGWTHYGRPGQTEARLNELTRDVEIKERRKWVLCYPGTHEFFTPKPDQGFAAISKPTHKDVSRDALLEEARPPKIQSASRKRGST